MSITRARLTFEDHYTQLPNRWARDGRLTLKARGLLAQLLSHRAGWRVSVASLAAVNPEGRDAIRGAIAELEAHGYLARSQRVDDESGRFGGVEYVLADPWADSPSSDNPSTVPPAETGHNRRSEPVSGFPTTGEPTAGNPPPKKNIPTEEHLTEEHEKSVGDSAAAAPPPESAPVKVDSPGARDDVETVCDVVADHVALVTGERPKVSKAWRTQARLMLDRDGRSVMEVVRLVAWVSSSSFWSPNVLSVPKLREKWPRLVAEARQGGDRGRGGTGGRDRFAESAAALMETFEPGGVR